ncbi:50S ribosomal protein L7ae [Williamsoniiplasma somnilux]|uniref:50S ribosomal protein L7ae n=1 Tax=Williamsoniiplasma somnilux TaxID=215578 RepID=A0A2K8NYR1_9MOLU|nr:ribosomal L7Ae/L30e/S12e/Gadd45 family protein [Williamsoniiplasma somnilux]ATZ18696.1 50S ribosomal protein L7ae [Williamsoniiplasma somnilux]
MDKKKLTNAIGLAFNSTKIISGEKLFDFIKSNKVSLVIVGSNMGPSQKKKITDKCKFYNIEYFDDLLTVEEIAQACGQKLKVAIGTEDINIIKLIKSAL